MGKIKPLKSANIAGILGKAITGFRIRTPLLYLLFVMLLLSLQRLVILTSLRDRFTDASAQDLIICFVTGWRFDLVVACYFTAPLLIAFFLMWPALQARQSFQKAVCCYCSLTLALVLFSCIADFYFFKEFGLRLDHKVLDYMGDADIYKIIWDDFPVVTIFLGTAGMAAAFAWFFRGVKFFEKHEFSLVRAVALPLLVFPLLFLGIRSSLGPKPINSGLAYFSNSMALSQLTLNGIYTLGEAVDSIVLRRESLKGLVDMLPEKEAFALTLQALARPEDELLNDPNNPLRRITDSERPENRYNVIIVIMESLSWHYFSAMDGLKKNKNLTPNLDELAADGVMMDRCFAVGHRTRFALSGILCGFLDLPGESVVTCSETEGNFFTIGHVLEERGYETMFIYGGDPLFDHSRAFLRSNGFKRFVYEDDFSSRTFRTHLGFCDEDLFNQAHKEFVAMDREPFLAVLLTLSFHRPYLIPEGRCEPVMSGKGKSDQLTSVRYMDWAIGHFMQKARKADYFDRTIFVFVTDHTGGKSGHLISPSSYRIPFLIYAPAILGTGRRVKTVCSQTDVAPTIMSILGGRYTHCFFGSSVLDRPPETGMAMMQHGARAMAFIDGNEEVAVIPFGGETKLYQYKAPGEIIPMCLQDPEVIARRDRLRRQALAMLGTAEALFLRGTYNIKQP